MNQNEYKWRREYWGGNMAKLIDETGNIYGDLIVQSRAEDHINPSGKHRVQWNCLCSCGNTCIVMGESLRNGRTKSCGKCGRNIKNREKISDKITEEMIGKTYNFLKVIGVGDYDIDVNGKRRRKVICQCLLCNNIIETRANWIKNGTIGSCGHHNKSRGELYVRDFLKTKNYKYKEEFSFSDLSDKKVLRFDFAILDNTNQIKGCIEIQGSQHYDSNNGWYSTDVAYHDKMKQEYCKNNNIPLLILNYSGGQEKTDFSIWNEKIIKFIGE